MAFTVTSSALSLCLQWQRSMGPKQRFAAAKGLLSHLREDDNLSEPTADMVRQFAAGISQQCEFDVDDWGGPQKIGEVAGLLYSLSYDYRLSGE